MKHFETYVNAIRKSAHHYSSIYNVEYEELEAQGYLIYCECLRTYDASKSTFITHLTSELRRLGDYAYSIGKHGKYANFSIDDDDNIVEFESNDLPSLDDIVSIGRDCLSTVACNVLEYILKRSWEKVGRAKPTITNVCDDLNITRDVAKKVWNEIGDFYKKEHVFVM